jgi:hypothetical protein
MKWVMALWMLRLLLQLQLWDFLRYQQSLVLTFFLKYLHYTVSPLPLPNGATVKWSKDDCIIFGLGAKNSSNVSNMSTNTLIGGGGGIIGPPISQFHGVSARPDSVCTWCPQSRIYATVTYNGCSVILPYKEVRIGDVPDVTKINSVLNGENALRNCPFMDTITYFGEKVMLRPPYGNSYGITGAEWILGSGNGVTFIPLGSTTETDRGWRKLQIQSWHSYGTYASVNVKLQNGCGWSEPATIRYFCVQGFCSGTGGIGGGIRVSYSPNPTNNELIVNFEELPTMENSNEVSVAQNIDVLSMPQNPTNTNQTATYSVKLLDASGMVLRQAQFTHLYGEGTPQPVRFNLSSLRKGTYFLHVEGGGELVREQIVVK